MHCLSVVSLVAVWQWQTVSCASQTDVFSERVEQLLRSATPTEERQQLVPRVLSHLERTLNLLWPECRVRPYGSYVYGLANIFSDVDASIMIPEQPSISQNNILVDIRTFLEQYPDQFTNFKAVTWVLAPVLSFKHASTNFSIDICINAHREFVISDLIKYLIGIDERVYKLAFIVKYWAKVNNMTGAHLLANYGMLILVIFYFQQKKMLPTIESLQREADPYILSDWNYGYNEIDFKVQNNETLNALAGEFFEYYATFDFKKYVVCPYVGYPIERKLFENLDSVPDEFVHYKQHVRSNTSEQLPVTKPVLLQDIFIHNQAVMSFQSSEYNSSFIRLFNFAARKYKENNNTFLNEILQHDVILFMTFFEGATTLRSRT